MHPITVSRPMYGQPDFPKLNSSSTPANAGNLSSVSVVLKRRTGTNGYPMVQENHRDTKLFMSHVSI